jgi:hypothetical protein
MRQSDEDGEPQSINDSAMNEDPKRGALDRCDSSLPTEVPPPDAPAQLDPSVLDPLDSCETIPVPRLPDSMKPVDPASDAGNPEPSTAVDASTVLSSAPERAARSKEDVHSLPPVAAGQEVQIAVPKPVASNPEPSGPDPVVEIQPDAPVAEGGEPESADESKAHVAFDSAAEMMLPDEEPSAEVHEAASPPSNVAGDETGDATSSSAHVLPIAGDPSVETEGTAIASEPDALATREAVLRRGIKSTHWLVLAAVAVVIGLWRLPRLTPELAKPPDMHARVAAPVVGGDSVSRAEPTPPTAMPAASIPESATPIRQSTESLPESSGALGQSPATPAAVATAEKTQRPRVADEPARLSAYKAAASAGRNATKCRHAGDSPGVVHVAVTFDPSGHVRRAHVQSPLSNPMTLRCIRSQFDELTIPPFTGDATRVAVDVRIY